MNTLTMSQEQRQKVLNYLDADAIPILQETLGISGVIFEGEYRFTKKMVVDFYQVEEKILDRLLDQYGEELSRNGYTLIEGERLKEFRLQFGNTLDVDNKPSQLGLFNFLALVNIGMLLSDNEKAEMVRSKTLDKVISTINCRTGGGSNYINPLDVNSSAVALEEWEQPLDFDKLLNLPENKEVLRRLKQADDDDE